MNARSARGGAHRARVSRGRLPSALGQALALLPGQVPLRDAARAAAPAGRADRGDGARARAGRDAAGCAGARRRRARRGRIARLRAAVPDRAQGGEGVRHRQSPRRARTRTGSACASSRTSSPPAVRCSSRSTRCAARDSSCTPRSASSTVRKAAQTRSPAHAVRLRPLFRACELLAHVKSRC